MSDPKIRAAAITQALRQTAPEHLSPEAKYRFYERLGILCGNAAATETELRIALLEAAEYDLNCDDLCQLPLNPTISVQSKVSPLFPHDS